MVTFTIYSTELSRLLFNALLFAQENSFIGGVALFALDDEKLEMTVSDNYVGIIDFAAIGKVSSSSKATGPAFLIQRKGMNKLAKWCGELNEVLTVHLQDFTLTVKRVESNNMEETKWFGVDDPSTGEIILKAESVSEYEPLLMVSEKISGFEIERLGYQYLNVSPTKMSRIARLKVGDDLPLSLYPANKGFFFTTGPIKGFVTSLKEEE